MFLNWRHEAHPGVRGGSRQVARPVRCLARHRARKLASLSARPKDRVFKTVLFSS